MALDRYDYAKQLFCVHLFDDMLDFFKTYQIKNNGGEGNESKKRGVYKAWLNYQETLKEKGIIKDIPTWSLIGHYDNPVPNNKDLFNAINGFYEFCKTKGYGTYIDITKYTVNPFVESEIVYTEIEQIRNEFKETLNSFDNKFVKNTIEFAWNIRCAYSHDAKFEADLYLYQKREICKVYLFSSIMLYYYYAKANGLLKGSIKVNINVGVQYASGNARKFNVEIGGIQMKAPCQFQVDRYEKIGEIIITDNTDKYKIKEIEPFDHLAWDVDLEIKVPECSSSISKLNTVYSIRVNDALVKNANDNEIETIRKIIEQLENNIKARLDEGCIDEDTKGKINEIYKKVSEAKDVNELKGISKQLDELPKRTADEIGARAKSWINRMLLIALVSILFISVGIVGIDLYNGWLSACTCGLKEWCYDNFGDEYKPHYARLAYDAGSESIAYQHATYLDSVKNYHEAATWYDKAASRYESLTELSPTNAHRLALIYLQGKSGVLDIEKARKFAHVSAPEYGKGLYIYLLATIGDEYLEKAKIELASYNHLSWTDDDYLLLANAFVNIDNEKDVEHQREIIDSLASSTSEARLEASFLRAQLTLRGYKDIVTPQMVEGVFLLESLALEHNYLPAQIEVGLYWFNIGRHDQAFSMFDRAISNNCLLVVDTQIQTCANIDFPDKDEYINNLKKLRDSEEYLQQESPLSELLKANYLRSDSLFSQANQMINAALHKSSLNNSVVDVEISVADKVKLELQSGNNNIDSLVDLIHEPSSISMEMRQAAANYLQSVRYAKGYGVEADMDMSDSLLNQSAGVGYPDAIYSKAMKYRNAGDLLNAVRLLNKIEATDEEASIRLYSILCKLDKKLGENYLIKKTQEHILKTIFTRPSNIEGLRSHIDKLHNLTLRFYKERNTQFLYVTVLKLIDCFFEISRIEGMVNAQNFRESIGAYYYYLSRLNPNDYCSCYWTYIVLTESSSKEVVADAFEEFCFRLLKKSENKEMRNIALNILANDYPEKIESLRNRLKYDIMKDYGSIENFDPDKLGEYIDSEGYNIVLNDEVYKY